MEHSKVDEHYLLSLFYGDKVGDFTINEYNGDVQTVASDDVRARMDEELKDKFLTHEQIEEIGKAIHMEFDQKNAALVQATDQALIELLASMPMPEGEKLDYLAKCRFDGMVEDGLVSDFLDDEGRQEVLNMLKMTIANELKHYHGPTASLLDTSTLGDGIGIFTTAKNLTPQQQKFLDDRITYYRAPLSSSEQKKITIKAISEMMNFDMQEALGDEFNTIAIIYEAAMATVKKHSEVKSLLSSLLHRRYITAEDTTLRCLLDPKVDKKAADARLYKLVTDILRKDPDFFKLAACVDREILVKHLKAKDPEVYNSMMAFREITGTTLSDYYKK